jgi:toxin ParE1/3/4
VSVILRPDAETDVRDVHDSLEQIRSGLGKKFVDEVGKILERLESFPRMYGVVWKDVRAVRVKRFRYVIYYVAFSDRIEVLAVMHGARDAAAWRTRV